MSATLARPLGVASRGGTACGKCNESASAVPGKGSGPARAPRPHVHPLPAAAERRHLPRPPATASRLRAQGVVESCQRLCALSSPRRVHTLRVHYVHKDRGDVPTVCARLQQHAGPHRLQYVSLRRDAGRGLVRLQAVSAADAKRVAANQHQQARTPRGAAARPAGAARRTAALGPMHRRATVHAVRHERLAAARAPLGSKRLIAGLRPLGAPAEPLGDRLARGERRELLDSGGPRRRRAVPASGVRIWCMHPRVPEFERRNGAPTHVNDSGTRAVAHAE
eukprot:5682723-Prymnesium_polylepis.2